MSTVYATVDDLRRLRSLTAQEEEAAAVLLPQASAKLRLTAQRYRVDIDARIADETTGEDYAQAVQSVVVAAVFRALSALGQSATATQNTESIGAYSLTYTFANAGQQLYFLRNELRELDLLRQTFGMLDIYGGGSDVHE